MLRVRWLGRVPYEEASAVQHALFRSQESHLLLLEHPHVFTLGHRADPANVLTLPSEVGAGLVRTDRGGDVTYHGPGQLVGYPIFDVARIIGGPCEYVEWLEQLVIDVLADVGLPGAGRKEGYPGVWFDDRKICAIGVRMRRGRSMHGFALNVDPDLSMFEHIVPCGIADFGVTSLAAEGVHAELREVVDALVSRVIAWWHPRGAERQDVTWYQRPEDLAPFSRDATEVEMNGTPVRLLGRLGTAGVNAAAGVRRDQPKPVWLRVKATMGAEYQRMTDTMRSMELVTVCEEAGCPNIFECWSDGTATFMINGGRCTRACGFCLVDTRRPFALDEDEPARVAEAVAELHLSHAVVTAVARDDLPDGGARAFAETIVAIRRRNPETTVEVLIPDCKGEVVALQTIFAARPDVLNHNIETVARLQRAARPSASYARSLAVLARAAAHDLLTKSGIILGMGETDEEVLGAMADLRAVGVSIITIGQYLRPSAAHLPVARWVTPDTFDAFRRAGEAMGFTHVEASPLTRSSYHAKRAFEASVALGEPVSRS